MMVASHAGAVMAAFACGDALGARFEGFPWRWPQLAIRPGRTVQFWRRPFYWTDDTEMSLAFLLACRQLPVSSDGFEQVALEQLLRWRRGGVRLDMGTTTLSVLGKVADAQPAVARSVAAARASQGNGALMRCAAVAVVSGTAEEAADVAGRLAELSHASPEAVGSAAALAAVIHHAFLSGHIDPAVGVPFARCETVADALAAPRRPRLGRSKGWAPATLSAVLWSALSVASDSGRDSWVSAGLVRTVACGGDTDTNAALVAALLMAAAHQPLPMWAPRVHGGGWTGSGWDVGSLAELTASVAASAAAGNGCHALRRLCAAPPIRHSSATRSGPAIVRTVALSARVTKAGILRRRR